MPAAAPSLTLHLLASRLANASRLTRRRMTCPLSAGGASRFLLPGGWWSCELAPHPARSSSQWRPMVGRLWPPRKQAREGGPSDDLGNPRSTVAAWHKRPAAQGENDFEAPLQRTAPLPSSGAQVKQAIQPTGGLDRWSGELATRPKLEERTVSRTRRLDGLRYGFSPKCRILL